MTPKSMMRSEQIREALSVQDPHVVVTTLQEIAREYADLLDAATEPDYELIVGAYKDAAEDVDTKLGHGAVMLGVLREYFGGRLLIDPPEEP